MVPHKDFLGKGPKGRKLEMRFDGGCITSDTGVVALGLVDDSIELLKRVAALLPDPRDPTLIEHSALSMLQQRVYGICLGYEDLNDHDRLRHDIAFQSAASRDNALASSPTLCRMENWATREVAWGTHRVLVDTFIASFATPPEQIILDFDATDDRVYGNQEGRHFNGYYDEYVFLPLQVTCGDQLLVSYLRPGRSDAALHAGAVLRILVREIRKHWPACQIVFRADGGFCREYILNWCERNHVLYTVGLPKNSRLNDMAQFFALRAQYTYEEKGKQDEKARVVDSFWYSAGSWKGISRKVICRAEYGEKGIDLRYVVTNIKGSSKELYEEVYCGRGHAENHIKDMKLTLFSDRTSCQQWYSNQFRMLLSALAYTLMEHLRRVGLGERDPAFVLELQGHGSDSESQEEVAPSTLEKTSVSTDGRSQKRNEFQQTSFESIRLRLLKVGAVIVRNTRRVTFRLSSAFPLKEKFLAMMARLAPA